MIYILAGTDRAKRSAHREKITKDQDTISISPRELSIPMLSEYATSVSLFGGAPVIVVENGFKESGIVFSAELLSLLRDSETVFIFLEDKILAAEEKKYSKYATIVRFDEKKIAAAKTSFNTFDIATAYAKRDKVRAWVLYREAIESGVEPEAISGILFWKIKTLIQSPTSIFTALDLKKRSGDLVSLYHKAHRGDCDFAIGLEQFILSSLSK